MPLVLVSQARSFSGDALEDVMHKAVHDGHSLAADTNVGVNLLENFVDVNSIALLVLSAPLGSRCWLASLLLGGGCLLGARLHSLSSLDGTSLLGAGFLGTRFLWTSGHVHDIR